MIMFTEGWELLANVRKRRPLIHCITNYVSAGDVANLILAVGASPIMADGITEVEEIVQLSQGVVLNLGTLKETAVDVMLLAGKRARDLVLPIVFDPVGAGASRFRTEIARQMVRDLPCTVIRGNASEIAALAGQKVRTQGVDAAEGDLFYDDNRYQMVQMAHQLSEETGAIIVITGAQDLVADKNRFCLIHNGNAMMSRVTGTGCMLDGVIAAFLGGGNGVAKKLWFWQVAYAVAAMGICSEMAYEKTMKQNGGTGSFRMYLMDAMSCLSDRQIKEGINIEV